MYKGIHIYIYTHIHVPYSFSPSQKVRPMLEAPVLEEFVACFLLGLFPTENRQHPLQVFSPKPAKEAGQLVDSGQLQKAGSGFSCSRLSSRQPAPLSKSAFIDDVYLQVLGCSNHLFRSKHVRYTR